MYTTFVTVPEKSNHILHIQKSVSFIGDSADITKIVSKYCKRNEFLNLKDSKLGKILHVNKTGYARPSHKQVSLAESGKQYVVINTLQGL